MKYSVRRAMAILATVVLVGLAGWLPSSVAQGSLSINLTESPFLCDGATRALGTVSGLIPGERVEISSPELNGVFSSRTAAADGTVAMRWSCKAAKTWTITVRGLSSGSSATFVLTGNAAPPPADAPIGAAFDARSTLTANQMAIWKDFSPFSTVGVYIPVQTAWDNRSDKAQVNLTSAWVSTVVADGWKIIPIYVGRQAPATCATARYVGMANDPTVARSQGSEAALDAIGSVSRLGMGIGSPIYYDMEAYRTGCTDAVLAFLDAWTETLHANGYVSGVYGSRNSVMTDLTRAYNSAGFDPPDAVWVSTDNGQPGTMGLEVPPDGLWTNARIHQYRLHVTRTYGGVTVEIDENIATAPLFGGAPAPVVVRVDSDGDGHAEPEPDNCDGIANPDQADLDGDGDGDVCDADIDGDGVPNAEDADPRNPAVGARPTATAVPAATSTPTTAPTAAPTAAPVATQAPEPTTAPATVPVAATTAATSAPINPSAPAATPAPASTVEAPAVIVLPTPTGTPAPTPTAQSTAPPAPTSSPGDTSEQAGALTAAAVTITVEQESALPPLVLGALASFSLFCATMGVRSFRRSRPDPFT